MNVSCDGTLVTDVCVSTLKKLPTSVRCKPVTTNPMARHPNNCAAEDCSVLVKTLGVFFFDSVSFARVIS